MSGNTDDPTGAALRHLVGLMRREREEAGFASGDLAELRHMDPLGAALPPVLWRLLTEPTIEKAITAAPANREATERGFAIVIQVMAEAGPLGETPIGTALAETGYAEQRFVRLLRTADAPPPSIASEARLAARWCATQGVRVRFTDEYRNDGFGPFILAAALGHQEAADRRAHTIARAYFRALSSKVRTDTATEA